MGWFHTHAGGENYDFEINTECVEYVEFRTFEGEQRADAVLHMASGRKFTISRERWEALRADLMPNGR